MADEKNTADKEVVIEEVIKATVLKYVADGNKICLTKAKDSIAALTTVADKVKAAAKKQIAEEKAALEASEKAFE